MNRWTISLSIIAGILIILIVPKLIATIITHHS